MKKSLLLILLILSSIVNLNAQQDVKIMTYNLLNYDSTIDTSRNTYFREIISATQPDILVVEEIQNQYSVDAFLNNVMNSISNNYKAGMFIPNLIPPPPNNYDYYENAIFLDTTKFKFISNTAIHTDLRDINEFKLTHISTNNILRIYAVHLKASSGTANENKRAAEVDSLRKVTNNLPSNSDFIVTGDFNFYNSTEPGYTKLLDNSKTGYFLDPINQPGDWHDNSSFSIIHTQSTRTSILNENIVSGLDDRFDFILISQAVKDASGIVYKTGTYKSYGNDGNHLNKSINEQPNDSVSTSIANALYYASDHLPVIATFQYPNATGIEDVQTLPIQFSLRQNYPNPFNPETAIGYQLSAISFVTLKVFDVLGREVAILVNEKKPAGNYEVKFNSKNLTSGIYFYRLTAISGSNKFTQTKKMILLR